MSETVCLPVARVMVRVPVLVPEAVGLKVTVTVQDLPAAMEEPQVVESEKSPLKVMPLIAMEAELLLLTVTVCGELATPIAVVPKVSEPGLDGDGRGGGAGSGEAHGLRAAGGAVCEGQRSRCCSGNSGREGDTDGAGGSRRDAGSAGVGRYCEGRGCGDAGEGEGDVLVVVRVTVLVALVTPTDVVLKLRLVAERVTEALPVPVG